MFKLNLSKAIVDGECGTKLPDKFLACNLEVKQKGTIIENPEGMVNEQKEQIVVDKFNKKEQIRKGFFMFGGKPPGTQQGPQDTAIVFGNNNYKYILAGFNMLRMCLPTPFYFLNGTPVHFEIAMLAVTEEMGNKSHMSNMLTLRVPILPSTDKTPATQQIEKMINGIVRASPEVPGSLKLGISIDMSLFFTGGASYYAMKSKEQTNFTQVIVGTDGSIPLSNEYFIKFFKLFMRQGGLTPDGKLPPNMNTWPKIQRLIAKDPLSKMSEARKTGKQFDPYEQIYISNEGINNGGNEKGSREVDERGKKTVSSKGNTYNVDYSAGDVYIDCQPVNIDEEQTNVKMEGYKLQSEMDIIPTKEKIMEYLMNPWVQGFILFLVILILFMVVKMLMAKGKTQGKADLDTGS